MDMHKKHNSEDFSKTEEKPFFEFLTISQFARLADVSEVTIRRAADSGSVKFMTAGLSKIRLFHHTVAEKYIAQRIQRRRRKRVEEK